MDPTARTTHRQQSSSSSSSSSSYLTISSTEIIRLILVHLMECGLYETCTILQKESGIGMKSSLYPCNNQFWFHHCSNGYWGIILQELSYFDKDLLLKVSVSANSIASKSSIEGQQQQRPRPRRDLRWVIASVHEMTILELAEAGEWELAYATYRLVQNELSEIMIDNNNNNNNENNDNNDDNKDYEGDNDDDSDAGDEKKKKKKKKKSNNNNGGDGTTMISMSRSIEQKLAELANGRNKDIHCVVPNDYYGTSSTKQQRRDMIGKLLEENIPQQPKNRLISLLQHSMKWQMYTGQMPRIKRIIEEVENDDDGNEENKIIGNGDDDNNDEGLQQPKKRQRKTVQVVKEFDLVLGEVYVDPVTVGNNDDGDDDFTGLSSSSNNYKVIGNLDKWSTIKFGKNATPEAALFLPDYTASLITGSSDGLIEIWDASKKYTSLRTDDLLYQKNEELLGHDDGNAITALAITNDCQLLASGDNKGRVNIWRFDTGKCFFFFFLHFDNVYHYIHIFSRNLETSFMLQQMGSFSKSIWLQLSLIVIAFRLISFHCVARSFVHTDR